MQGTATDLTKTKTPDHEYIIRLHDSESGLNAIVAIHSTALGLAHGGTRMKVYKTEESALADVLDLSQAMSYKSALAGLPYGGAKGVIILNGLAPINKDKILTAYAKKIDKLGGLFHTGTDVGLTDQDTIAMSRISPYIIGLPKQGNSEWSTSNAAARGVFNAIQTAAQYKYGRPGLSGLSVAVKGTGKLGGHLVDLLVEAGATTVIADTDNDQVEKLKARYNDLRVVQPTVIHKQRVNIYAPCALGGEFSEKSIAELSCDIVCGGANNQLKTGADGDALHAKGITYIPDYIANAGGLIFVCEDLESDGFNPDRVGRRLQNIKKTVKEVLEKSEKLHLPTHRVADKMALERIKKGKK